MKKVIRRIRRFMAGHEVNSRDIFARQDASFQAATLLIRIFAGIVVFSSMNFLLHFNSILVFNELVYLWPVAWMSHFSRFAGLNFIVVGSLLSSLFMLAKPELQISRVLAMVFFLFETALIYAEGNVGHASHATLWIFFILALCPSWRRERNSRALKQRVLSNFACTQLMFASTYGWSAIWKLRSAIHQCLIGQPNAFQPSSLARTIAHRLLTGNTDTLLGSFMIDHVAFSWMGFWFAVYVEFFIVVSVFRPKIQRNFGLALTFFHMMAVITLSPNFRMNALMGAIFFVCSPFHLYSGWREQLQALPGWGLVRWAQAKAGFQSRP